MMNLSGAIKFYFFFSDLLAIGKDKIKCLSLQLRFMVDGSCFCCILSFVSFPPNNIALKAKFNSDSFLDLKELIHWGNFAVFLSVILVKIDNLVAL